MSQRSSRRVSSRRQKPRPLDVFVRCRPLTNGEAHVWTVDGNSIFVNNESEEKAVTVDQIFDGSCNNNDVYHSGVKHTVDAVLQGINGTVIAYGQTGSGKTHTVHGSVKERGLLMHAVDDLFDAMEATPDREFLVRVAYMEIYREEIVDLLADKAAPAVKGKRGQDTKLELQVVDTREGTTVRGLTYRITGSRKKVKKALRQGDELKKVGMAQDGKERNNRSHTIFKVVVESRVKQEVGGSDDDDDGALGPVVHDQRWIDDLDTEVLVSDLTFVDLAGSERVGEVLELPKEGENVEHKKALQLQREEGIQINLSLSAFGNVIAKLAQVQDKSSTRSHISFRGSKLTRLLQPALGGNARTTFILTIQTIGDAVEETKSTLQFAKRAKKVYTAARTNLVHDDASLLIRQDKDIRPLEKQISKHTDSSGLPSIFSPEQQEHHEAVMKEAVEGIRSEMLELEQEKDRIALMYEQEKASRMTAEDTAEERAEKAKKHRQETLKAQYEKALVQIAMNTKMKAADNEAQEMTEKHERQLKEIKDEMLLEFKQMKAQQLFKSAVRHMSMIGEANQAKAAQEHGASKIQALEFDLQMARQNEERIQEECDAMKTKHTKYKKQMLSMKKRIDDLLGHLSYLWKHQHKVLCLMCNTWQDPKDGTSLELMPKKHQSIFKIMGLQLGPVGQP